MDHTHRDRSPRSPRLLRRWLTGLLCAVLAVLVLVSGCAKFNTYYNAKKAFDDAEHQREERLKQGEDVSRATSAQKQDYDSAIKKAQKILDEYPGHSLTDDALFIQGKSYQRIASYRMSIRKLDLLFTNFPQTPYLEESIFLQAVNYLMLGDAGRSQDLLDRLETQFPDSRFQSQALRSSGDNAYALERWEDAVTAYQRFLERFPDAENWDDSSMRLAESLYELERYAEAVDVLERVIDESLMTDRVFRARLLQARSLVHLGEYGRVEQLVGELKGETMIESRAGEVTLVEAENLLAQGDRSAAVALLEGMPEEQQSREVKPVRADLLGQAAMAVDELENEDLEQAREYYQEALTGRQYLEEPEATTAMLDNLRRYLDAAGRVADADPARAAEYRLVQANAMLFGFDRSRRALELYASVAADTAADSLVAPRGLYGAMIVYDSYLDDPDSAAIFREELEARFPDSPQAYEARGGANTDLLAYLLEQEELALAASRADSLIDLDDLGLVTVSDEPQRGSGLRRRKVYLQRRAALVYPPTAAALRNAEARRAELELAQAQRDTLSPVRAADLETLSFAEQRPDTTGLQPGPGVSALADSALTDTALADSALAPEPVPVPADTVAADAEEEPAAEKEKKRSWDF
jgi:outer membrane protein assembly factor BamD (BamD/ComL family)